MYLPFGAEQYGNNLGVKAKSDFPVVVWSEVYIVVRDATDGADSCTVCFRITNYSYEYVKWLNRENEVKIKEARNEHGNRSPIVESDSIQDRIT